MARKRMFSNDIINTDDFIDMPLSAQALYFHLGMNADDEGFIQPKRILRMIQAKEDDMKVLIAKNFLKIFNSGVVVITDWHTNNYLDSTRAKPTEYVEERLEIGLTGAKKYEFNNCLTFVEQTLNQSRVEESRVEENSIEKTKEKKRKYGEDGYVLLKEGEYEKLIEAFGDQVTNVFIGQLNDYIGQTGKRYKSHYHTVRNWIRRRAEKQVEKKSNRKIV